MQRDGVSVANGEMITGFLLTAGLYAANLLVTIIAVLVSVTTISGEIDSHTIETLITKPVRRWEVVLGKWLAFALLLIIYILFLAGGLMIAVYLRTGFLFQNVGLGLGIMILQALIILSLTGVLAFTLYAIAFMGGWIEQIGALFRNEAAVDIGIVTSLIMPSEILWKKALTLFQPTMASMPFSAGPFAVASQPSDLMVAYGVIYMVAFLLFAMWSFSRRDL
jgi:ABC-type transport system involved in multi-copper enzyme maturation permease subunit